MSNKEVKLRNELYIGINGTGKTEKLNEISKQLTDVNNVIFHISNSIETVEKYTASPTRSNFDKSYWGLFIDQLINLTTINVPELKYDQLSDEIKKEVEENFKRINENVNSGEINLLDNITKKIIKNDSLNMKLKKIDDEENIIAKNISFPIIVEEDFKNEIFQIFSKDISKDRGTGNYQYLVIKFIYEFVRSGLISDDKLADIYLIIDEPELYLHPSLKRRVGKILNFLSYKINTIIATHSQSIASLVIENPEVKTLIGKSEKNFVEVNISKAGRGIGEQARLGFVKNMFANKIIIVEGNTDLDLVEYMIDEIEKVTEIDINFNVHIADNKSAIPRVFDKLVVDYSISKDDIFIIYDKDSNIDENDYRKHKTWNDEIINLDCNNKFNFEKNLEHDLGINKKLVAEKKIDGKIRDLFIVASNNSKYIELEGMLKEFLEILESSEETDDE